MIYSLLAILVNLFLVYGCLSQRHVALLPWLIVYLITALLGSVVLATIIPLTIGFRDRDFGDVEMEEVVWFLIPLLLFVFYSILWIIVLQVYIKLRREHTRLISGIF